jgi:hypothetical protein
MPELDPKAVKRVSGPSWKPLKPAVLAIADALLSASDRACSEMGTIHVRFERPDGSTYAIMWLKKSSQVVVGLALGDEASGERLHEAPQGLTFPGLTRYFTVAEGDEVPPELPDWARAAWSRS